MHGQTWIYSNWRSCFVKKRDSTFKGWYDVSMHPDFASQNGIQAVLSLLDEIVKLYKAHDILPEKNNSLI